MGINFSNFLNPSKDKNTKINDFQDLDHLDGVGVSTISANLYGDNRDDLVMFYFRDGANHASVYTQSKIRSENIKWNTSHKSKKIYSLIVNTRNANALTGNKGYQSLEKIAEIVSDKLTEKQKSDDNNPDDINVSQIMFGCTGTIGEPYPFEKIRENLYRLIDNVKYTQNKYVWIKAALGIMTTDTKPKLAMEECYIGKSKIKIYGIAKGSGMIHPNMATTLGYIFTDANLSNEILKKILKKNIETTFNAISCDGDTSTNDMVSIFSTGRTAHTKINNLSDPKLKDFDSALNSVLLNLAKRIVSDGEGSSKLVTINILNCQTEEEAKKIGFSIANSPLVKTAIAGEDPNWGRILMAVGKAGIDINLPKLQLKFGEHKIFQNGKLHDKYDEKVIAEYMKNEILEITVNISTGTKNFTTYTMDLTKKYIEINADYRS